MIITNSDILTHYTEIDMTQSTIYTLPLANGWHFRVIKHYPNADQTFHAILYHHCGFLSVAGYELEQASQRMANFRCTSIATVANSSCSGCSALAPPGIQELVLDFEKLARLYPNGTDNLLVSSLRKK